MPKMSERAIRIKVIWQDFLARSGKNAGLARRVIESIIGVKPSHEWTAQDIQNLEFFLSGGQPMRTIEDITGFCPCPKCGGKGVYFLANARGYFQVRCLECGHRTPWLKKVEAVIAWFNEYLAKFNTTPMQKRSGYHKQERAFKRHTENL